ncbi:MAG: aldo/keto reductase [Bacteroides sp.]|nr:aldo/keto reductase [Prevotella sp.]MCM1407742.1 aldo/keto reductase [Treponema brennaborense]MCM1469108.1 aldo/keto reductase [Bacteroides sp.]
MIYRTFPKIPDISVSQLGYGTMRLPLLHETDDAFSADIDIDKTRSLIELAFSQGINYFDTAYPYHGGASERVLGSCLADLHLRDSVFIADKCPVWLIHDESDWMRILDEQLERLQTDHIDFYLLHALKDFRWRNHVEQFNGLAFLEKAKQQGKIRHIGFSFHDTFDAFKKITDAYDSWEFCQIQYNYLDTEYQAGTKGLDYAAQHEIGIIAMEPLRGGMLANPAKGVLDIFSSADIPRVPAEWGLRWVWDDQRITCALSGMNSTEQIFINCAAASAGKPNSLLREERETVARAADWFKKRLCVSCASCNYCMPCPRGVAIPEIFSIYNKLSFTGAFDSSETVRSAEYAKVLRKNAGADQCVSCKACCSVCPQHLDIPAKLREAHERCR